MSEETLRPTYALPAAELPVRRIGLGDVVQSLSAAWADFLAKPSHTIYLCIIYPIMGLVLARMAIGGDLMPLLFPLVGGFAIIGPFAAIATYEISRRRGLGQDTSPSDVARLARHPAMRQIAEMAVVLLVLFVAWLVAARLIYSATLGPEEPASIGAFVHDVFLTSRGWALIIIGNAVGFVFAAVAFTVGVVSFPLLIDRNVGLATAIRTSVRSVAVNPLTLTVWGFVIAFGVALGIATLFVGLAVILPLLGHATWHMYRRLVP